MNANEPQRKVFQMKNITEPGKFLSEACWKFWGFRTGWRLSDLQCQLELLHAGDSWGVRDDVGIRDADLRGSWALVKKLIHPGRA